MQNSCFYPEIQLDPRVRFQKIQLDVFCPILVYDKNFLGGKGGGWGGGSSEGCLKWGVGVIKGSFQKHLQTGGG